MPPKLYENILRDAEGLPRRECLLLIEALSRRLRVSEAPGDDIPKWEEYGGSAPYPLCGEDAQDWVKRNRLDFNRTRPFP